jgi:hypothetical protein
VVVPGDSQLINVIGELAGVVPVAARPPAPAAPPTSTRK